MPARYLVVVTSPIGAPIATFQTTAPFLATPNAPPGVYHVRVIAANGAGMSAPSAEIIVVVSS